MVTATDEAELLAALRERPDIFASEVLGVTIYPHQAPILAALTGPKRRVAVRSCNSIGKDFLAAVATLWWPLIWDDCAVITTGPTWHQVETIIWGREVHGLYQRARYPLGGRLLATQWDISPRRRAIALSTVTKEALQGIHAEHVLIIVDEASAREIGAELWEALDGIMASGDSRLLALGNPTRVEGQFYDAFHNEAEGWELLHCSAFDTPNLKACEARGPHQVPAQCALVQPGLVTHEWVEDVRLRYGEDSDYWRVHVLGDFPESGADSVIPLAWIEAAIVRGYQERAAGTGLIAAGCDLARKGDDLNALAVVRDTDLLAIEEWSDPSLMSTVGRLLRFIEAHEIRVLAIDDTGLGGGVVDRLSELDHKCVIIPVNFSARASQPDQFHSKPSEMWWRLRETLSPEAPNPLTLRGSADILKRLQAQLTRARYQYDSMGMGRIWVDKYGKIGTTKSAEYSPESPDLADALCLALEAWSAYVGGMNAPARQYHRESFLG